LGRCGERHQQGQQAQSCSNHETVSHLILQKINRSWDRMTR
jgi:hypothetical protein